MRGKIRIYVSLNHQVRTYLFNRRECQRKTIIDIQKAHSPYNRNSLFATKNLRSQEKNDLIHDLVAQSLEIDFGPTLNQQTGNLASPQFFKDIGKGDAFLNRRDRDHFDAQLFQAPLTATLSVLRTKKEDATGIGTASKVAFRWKAQLTIQNDSQ